MKNLEKLNSKKVESLASIKGGRLALISELSADTGAGGTTVHSPTHRPNLDIYVCDHKDDPK